MMIGELAARAGVTTRQLRFYEACGLLTAQRGKNNYRRYSESSIGRVEQIRGLLQAGLPSRVIASIIPCFDAPTDPIDFAGVTPEMEETLELELTRMAERIAALQRNSIAVEKYLRRLQERRDDASR